MKQFSLFFAFFLSLSVFAQDTLVIGIKNTPPFIVENPSGYGGISIELWQKIASDLGLEYKFVNRDLKGLIDETQSGEIDICINPLTVTAARSRLLNFTQPFYISGVGVATNITESEPIWGFLMNLLSLDFMKAVAWLFFVLLIFGILVWIPERKGNPTEFEGGFKGIMQSIWWSAVTMTTVGYGDKSPKTATGRFLAVIWMFTSVIIISSFTASIAASLTVNKFNSMITNAEDLKYFKVGTIANSSSAGFLDKQNTRHKNFATVPEMLNALNKKQIEVAVYDAPVLQYYTLNYEKYEEISVAAELFSTDYYSFSMSYEHPLFKKINAKILEELQTDHWQKVLARHTN